MKRMLFNATQAEELRVAIVDGQTLLDLDIETLGKEQRKGNIYKGVITRIEPSLEACFVDYGTDRHGFLPFKEVSRSYFQDYEGGRARIQDVLKEGMQVIVQVEKDERGNKGAALTTFISLAGRYLVLMPNNPRGGGVSRRIEGEERQELKAAMAELDVPRGMSLIARTAGIGRSVEELQWDFNYLQQLWQAIEEAGNAHNEPYLLFMESSLLIRAIRDYYRPDIGEILVDNQEVHEQISEFMSYVMPNNVGRLKLYQDHTPLFSRFQIEHQIESAFSRSVSLPSGGAIVIDHTEALVSIDVNSARATRGADIEDTAFKTNMEAAEEVARQMRLRDLGGLVVIDFIDMENPKHQRDVENVLRDALKKDRARVQMGKLSRFGLLELSRQRLKPALGESSHVACPRCAGTGVIRSIESTALHVLRIIQEEAMKDNTGEVHAQVPVDVATFLLNEKRAELFGLEERLDVSVFLIPNTHLENPHYDISRVRTDDVDENAGPSYKRVEVPETSEDDKPFGGEKAKAARPEPAVKGVKHTQPAPAPVAAQTAVSASGSWWGGFKSWLGKVFGSAPEPEETPEAEKTAARAGNRSGSRRPSNNRRPAPRRPQSQKQRNDDDVKENKEAAALAAPKENGTQEPRGRRSQTENRERGRNGQNGRAEGAPTETKAAAAVKAADKAEGKENRSGNDNRRRNRPEKAALPVADVAVSDVAVSEAGLPQGGAPAAEPAVQTASVQEKAVAGDNRANRRERAPSREQRDRRNNSKKRNIPSAAKIEQYLSIEEAGNKVRFAVAHVFGEAEEAPVAIAVSAPLAEDTAADRAAADQPLVVVLPSVAETVAEALPAESEPAGADAAVLFAIESDETAKTEAATVETAPVAVETASGSAEKPVVPQDGGVAAQTEYAATVSDGLDLGGLVLVQTRADALAAAAAQTEPETVGLRRSDVPKAAEAAESSVPLMQVETRK